jgi:hypothetical protein
VPFCKKQQQPRKDSKLREFSKNQGEENRSKLALFGTNAKKEVKIHQDIGRQKRPDNIPQACNLEKNALPPPFQIIIISYIPVIQTHANVTLST